MVKKWNCSYPRASTTNIHHLPVLALRGQTIGKANGDSNWRLNLESRKQMY